VVGHSGVKSAAGLRAVGLPDKRQGRGRTGVSDSRLIFCALAFAEKRLEGVGAGKVVEESLALFGIHVAGGEEFFALFAELFEPGFVFGTELLFEFFAEPLGERRALTGSGDGDLQGSALCYRGIVEVAKLGHVHHIAEDAAAASFSVNIFVQFVRVRGGDDKKHAIEIGGLSRASEPLDVARGSPRFYLRSGFGSDDADFGRRVEQARDFALGDGARADHEATPALELEEHREEAGSRRLLGDGFHRFILTEDGKGKIEKGPMESEAISVFEFSGFQDSRSGVRRAVISRTRW